MSSVHSKESDFINRVVYEWFGNNIKEIFSTILSNFTATVRLR
jgi:hypothetical protein